MRILVTGITGYVGRRLADALAARGHTVIGLARHPERAHIPYPVHAVDLTDGAGLDDALTDVDVAYYLVHSMEGTVDYAAAELAAARRFAAAAAAAGVTRIVYMSVLTPAGGEQSAHVRSRIAVERALASGGADIVVLRASIVIGAESRSFRFLLRLVERMPILPLPPWRERRTRPIDERDLLELLIAAATAPTDRGVAIYDAVGPDEVTYQALIERIRDHLMVARPTIPVPISLTAVTAPIAAAIAGEDLGLVAPLMQSLTSDLLPRTPDPREITLPAPRHHLDAAIEHALRDTDEIGD